MQGKWRNIAGSDGQGYVLGKIVVGFVVYDPTRSKGDPLRYVGHCRLPGFKNPVERFATTDEAKAHVEKFVNTWFRVIQS